ncbi:hypothetical protein [Paenibacillus sp. YN15]|uniref:hypothetical protein n=1 Tax=Paenibacillus sp. YN15 TaxID=1742774 RepID=UPI0015ECABB8|nr:hypothetical protein [Paenibacillus sp. YN15]
MKITKDTSVVARLEFRGTPVNVSPTYLYEGCAEEYEDLADVISVPLRSIPKGVRVA